MKKLLTLILTVITVGCFGQDSTYMKISGKNSGTITMNDSIWKSHNYAYYTIDNGVSKVQRKPIEYYRIKSDGTIELGDLIIDAVIKGLEKKGYILMHRDSIGKRFIKVSDLSLTKFNNK